MSGNTNDNRTASPVPRTYEEAVRLLAEWQDNGDFAMEIYELPDPQRRQVRLIEVSDEFPEAALDRRTPAGELEVVIPVYGFGPSKDYPYPSAVVQLTRREWDQLRAGELPLSEDWDLSSMRKLNDVNVGVAF